VFGLLRKLNLRGVREYGRRLALMFTIWLLLVAVVAVVTVEGVVLVGIE
jgi:hypothetical protein